MAKQEKDWAEDFIRDCAERDYDGSEPKLDRASVRAVIDLWLRNAERAFMQDAIDTLGIERVLDLYIIALERAHEDEYFA